MEAIDPNLSALKKVMKAAIVETIEEHRELFRAVLAEVIEDFAMNEAIREGKRTGYTSREKVFMILRGKE